MKPVAASILLAFSATTWADRLITVPTGTKVFSGHLKLEGLRWQDDDSERAWVTYGVNRSVEVGITYFRPSGETGKLSFDASYNIVSPILDTSPGISVGFLDGANVTPEGRAFYLATTFRLGNDGEYNQDVPTELHFGFWTRRTGLMFVGASLPLSQQVRLVAEHDSKSLTAGVDLRPMKPLSIKLLAREGRPAFGLAWTQKF